METSKSRAEESTDTKALDPLLNSKEKNSSEDDYSSDDYIIPDGGWGWMVTLSTFIIYVILDGSVFSFGVIYVELLDYFNETGGKTAVIGALLYGFPFLLAPFICAFVLHGGFRLVGCIGAILVSVSFLLTSFAPSIDFITVVLGIFGATGMEMGYVSSILCLTYYFDKRRGLATGLAMSGTGIGTFILPPLLEYLLQNYSWRGTCLILGGVCLNLLPCSMVLRPLVKKPKPEDKIEQFDQLLKKIGTGSNAIGRPQRDMSLSTTHLPTEKYQPNDGQFSKLHNSDSWLNKAMKGQVVPNVRYTNYFHHGGYALTLSHTSLEVDKNQSCLTHITDIFRKLSSNTMTILRSTVDWSLLKYHSFMLFGFSNFLLCVYFGVPYLYVPHLAVVSGISERDASFLISIMGITSTVSQIAIGWMGDKSKASVQIYIVCMFLCGGALMAMPFFPEDYGVFCALSVLFGVGASGNYALPTLILIDTVGLEKLTVAFGMLQVQQGVASLVGTPVGGWIFDATGSYFWAFMSGGICIFISGVVLIPVPFLLKLKMKESNDSASNKETEDTESQEMKRLEV